MRINVSGSGAVTLNDVVTCDGFVYDYPIRVQTHVHTDHMNGFNSSKGVQHILMIQPTLDLLIVEYKADIPNRNNIEAIPSSQTVSRENCQIRLLDSGHMLGSVQVEVTLPDGVRCGYSGDFAWPLEDVIEVEELVLDSTYGSPDSIRKFTQEDANNRFVDLVVDRIRSGPVMILAHRGTLQRAISCLDDEIEDPIIASPRLCNELKVYQQHGYSLTKVLSTSAEESRLILAEGRYIRLYETRDRRPTDIGEATSITLSAYMSRLDDPVVEYSEKAFCIALSDHADYEETLEYVRATGARRVITDNYRGRHGAELALALRQELGIDAQPSRNQREREWGR
jgi:putative mRNA 3-end processing factor